MNTRESSAADTSDWQTTFPTTTDMESLVERYRLTWAVATELRTLARARREEFRSERVRFLEGMSLFRSSCSDLKQRRHALRAACDRLHVSSRKPASASAPVEAASHPDLGGDPFDRWRLTPRERDVARLLVAGKSNAEVAAALGISRHTARHHTEAVLTKLGVHSRAQAGALLGGWAVDSHSPQQRTA